MFKIVEEFSRLSRSGVLGINARNANYTLKYNQRRYYPCVDNKLNTRKLAEAAGISVPKLLGVVESQGQVKSLPKFLERYSDFVIKPASGSGGSGILVFSGRSGGRYRKVSGDLLDEEELKYHVSNILAGMYSLGGCTDEVIIEDRIQFDPVFERATYLGVPDIRVIVLKGIPVMSMVRLPTRESDGKANLHQGAVGAGIDIATGRTVNGVWKNMIVTEHPDTGFPVTELHVPNWRTILNLAARCGEMVKLGYIGVDIVLDRRSGPMILEINARPGLNIQIANRAPLLPRLRQIEALKTIDAMSLTDKVNFAIEHFPAEETQRVDTSDVGIGWFCDTASLPPK